MSMRRALVSVYDKSGLEELAYGLAKAGVTIVSTGSTASRIRELGIEVTAVSDVTGFPECLDGRVKTLHPRVHGGILADRRNPEHVAQLSDMDIEPFDLVVVNLYPFRQTAAVFNEGGAAFDDVIEQIDIGGPAMVRAAAKNHANVAVVVDPADYAAVLEAASTEGFSDAARRRLAAKAFAHTASYDVAVASWFGHQVGDHEEPTDQFWPPFMGVALERAEVLRYGENPHQSAALYVEEGAAKGLSASGLAQAEQLHGKPMSYNNYVDADAAYRAAYDFTEPAVAIIKHANPCGIAVGSDIAQAHRRAHATDPVSAFGGVIAANRSVTIEMAQQIANVFTEVVVAPGYDEGALEILQGKKSVRLLAVADRVGAGIELRPISGGVLAQTIDAINAPGDSPQSWQLAAGEPADESTLADLVFAWRAVRSVKSNAILLAREGAAVGVGMGQVNRVDSARLAVSRAGERASGAVAASDAFFPFADGLAVLMEAGIRAVVQPGGSIRDDEVIAAAQAAGITMYLTKTRHFYH